ncbi:MAG TPA: bifunctional hydroxymethylpyrimidine kinase/phosphomethylpyrimidine kinase [Rhizomicrobium sp.]
MTSAPARLLVIAGSDSGGGAGVEADIKTATMFGVYAMTAITAVTVQDTRGVHRVHAMPPDMVCEQITRLADDMGFDAIKIGMLGTAAMIDVVASALERCDSSLPLVLDPVLTSTSGTPLLDDDAIALLAARLLPRTTLVTPNIPEAERLTGMSLADDESALNAGNILRSRGADAVLIKGGHRAGKRVKDLLVWENGVETYSFPRIATRHTHGTGCTLATAIACELAQHQSLPLAVSRARDFVQKAIQSAPGFGRGQGPLNHMHGLRAN